MCRAGSWRGLAHSDTLVHVLAVLHVYAQHSGQGGSTPKEPRALKQASAPNCWALGWHSSLPHQPEPACPLCLHLPLPAPPQCTQSAYPQCLALHCWCLQHRAVWLGGKEVINEPSQRQPSPTPTLTGRAAVEWHVCLGGGHRAHVQLWAQGLPLRFQNQGCGENVNVLFLVPQKYLGRHVAFPSPHTDYSEVPAATCPIPAKGKSRRRLGPESPGGLCVTFSRHRAPPIFVALSLASPAQKPAHLSSEVRGNGAPDTD